MGGGKQKEIHFTPLGENLMSDARRLLAGVDGILFNQAGLRDAVRIMEELDLVSSMIEEKLNTSTAS